MIVVKCNKTNWNIAPGQGIYWKCQEWCREFVGLSKVDWDYYSSSNTFVFERAEDATAFKLRFGV